jgi:hypothetical protein
VVAQRGAELQVDVDATNKQGRTALMQAAKHGQLPVVRQLVGPGGADLGVRMRDGSAVLDWAVLGGHLPTVEYLLGLGAARVDPLAQNDFGCTAVHLGARPHGRVAPPLIHFIPDLLRDSVPLFLKRQGDRTLGALGLLRRQRAHLPLAPSAPRGGVQVALAFPAANLLSVAFLRGRAGRLTATNGGSPARAVQLNCMGGPGGAVARGFDFAHLNHARHGAVDAAAWCRHTAFIPDRRSYRYSTKVPLYKT